LGESVKHEDPLALLPDCDREAIRHMRQELVEKLGKFRISRVRGAPPMAPSLRQLLLRCYDDLINGVVIASYTPTKDLEPHQASFPQSSAAAGMIDHVMNHDQLKSFPTAQRGLLARQLVGSVIGHAVETCDNIKLRLHMPIELFRG